MVAWTSVGGEAVALIVCRKRDKVSPGLIAIVIIFCESTYLKLSFGSRLVDPKQ